MGLHGQLVCIAANTDLAQWAAHNRPATAIEAMLRLHRVATDATETRVIIADSFRLTPLEIRRHGLGSFQGGDNISISIHKAANWPINFSILTYNGTFYSHASTEAIEFSFTASADYYEAVFFTDTNTENEIQFEVSVQKPKVLFPFSWLTTPAKILFFFSIGSTVLLLLKFSLYEPSASRENEHKGQFLSQKSRRILLILLLLSLVFLP